MKFHIDPVYPESCGKESDIENTYCTNEKDVDCPECLRNMRDTAVNSIFHFPRVKFVDDNGLMNQLEHIDSEFEEVYQSALTTDIFHTATELWDLIHSSETGLRILSEKYDINVIKAKEYAIKKNRERGYYD